MSLIKCPECGNEISSLARSCPNCGCPIDVDETNGSQSGTCCPECGQYVDATVKTCPNCGYPMNGYVLSDTSLSSRKDIYQKKYPKREWLIGGVVAVAALLLVSVLWLSHKEEDRKIVKHDKTTLIQKQNEERVRLEEENKRKEEEEKARKEMEEKARVEEEERHRENDINDMSWLYGRWRLETGGFIFWIKITKDNLKWEDISNGGIHVLWDGNYELYMNRIEINGSPALRVDLYRRKIYTLKGEAFQKR